MQTRKQPIKSWQASMNSSLRQTYWRRRRNSFLACSSKSQMSWRVLQKTSTNYSVTYNRPVASHQSGRKPPWPLSRNRCKNLLTWPLSSSLSWYCHLHSRLKKHRWSKVRNQLNPWLPHRYCNRLTPHRPCRMCKFRRKMEPKCKFKTPTCWCRC